MPVSRTNGDLSALDALFTATSAVCVTGLVVADTGQDFSPFGQTVIVLLIQLGGLGIMTFATLGTQMMGRRLSFRQQALIGDTFYQQSAANLVRTSLRRIVLLTFGCELVGAAMLYGGLPAMNGGPPRLFSAVFHSISAFCNAGFSLHSDSLTMYRARPVVMWTIMALIIVGGLGHTVALELLRRLWSQVRGHRDGFVQWSLNARVVMWTSAGLIAFGSAAFLLFGTTHDERTWGQALTDAVFQSVTARTAGFNTVDVGGLPVASLLILVGLMFVGGSPGSCAGGIKTTSMATWFSRLRSRLLGRRDVTLFGRRLPQGVIARTTVIVSLALVWNAAGCVILAATELPREGMAMKDLLFEQVSAFATVGLSTGVTSDLSATGKLWIIVSMFVGRLGPLTAAMAMLPVGPAKVRYPEEHLMVG